MVIDTTKPNLARVYDCFLGGKDNYAVDRAVFEQVDAVVPEMAELARTGRRWLERVVRFLAGTARIDQFLDLGAGLPTVENTHQTAQRSDPMARVVYVDNDPVVAAHGRARLPEDDRTRLVLADFTRPDEVLTDPEVVRQLDLDQPVALIHAGTLHHVRAEQDPWRMMRRYVELLAPGSWVAISHFHDPGDGGAASALARRASGLFSDLLGPDFHFRTREEIARLFDGLELVEPGLARLCDWWPDGPPGPATMSDAVALGGVAVKR